MTNNLYFKDANSSFENFDNKTNTLLIKDVKDETITIVFGQNYLKMKKQLVFDIDYYVLNE